MRIGPWDHGECRNGGHPDWVLSAKCGKLRSSDPKYLGCVEGWYTALAAQLKGLYWKDGGPIVISQVDNEVGVYIRISHTYSCASLNPSC